MSKQSAARTNNARTVRGRPFGPDNPPPGRKKGGHNKRTEPLTEALRTVVEPAVLAKKLYDMAKGGDLVAIKYVYDRIEGTPRQRIDIDTDATERDIERMAQAHGKSVEEIRKRAAAKGIGLVS